MVNLATEASGPSEADVLRQAFLKCLESIEYFLGLHPNSPPYTEPEMSRIKADCCRELMKHPAALHLVDDLQWRRAVRRFRELNLPPCPMDQLDLVPHFTAVELSHARTIVQEG